MKSKHIVSILLITGLIALISYRFMSFIGKEQNVLFEFAGWRSAYHSVFYILNEEIVFGSVILFSLTKQRKVNPLVASFILALAFSLGHFIFYKWIYDHKRKTTKSA
jgi:RsiW-degrading membrane proteinase PrsW (M82 family)